MNTRLLFATLAVSLATSGCDKSADPAPQAPAVPAPAPQSANPKRAAAKDTPEQLQALQGELPRMDAEKAKFIAVPSTPPDPKPLTQVITRKASPPASPAKAEEIKKPAEVKKTEQIKKASPAQ